MNKTYTALAAGAILGVLGARFLFVGSWLNLIPWSIAGFALGCWGTRNEAMVNGVVYGFVLCFIFMAAGYSGKFSLVSRVPFFAVLGVFGSACGLALGLAGFHARNKLRKGRKKR